MVLPESFISPNIQRAFGAVLFLAIALIVLRKMGKEHRAEHGSRDEREVERATGLGDMAKHIEDTEKQLRGLEEQGRGEIADAIKEGEDSKAVATKEQKASSHMSNESAAEAHTRVVKTGAGALTRAAKLANDEEQAEIALYAIQGRALGLVACLKLILQSIHDYISVSDKETEAEIEEVNHIDDIAKKIKGIAEYSSVDAHLSETLQALNSQIVQTVTADIALEKKKSEHSRIMVIKLKEAVNTMASIISDIRREQDVFERFERLEKKDYKDEMKALKNSYKAKEKELKQARKEGKDKQLQAKLQQELSLIQNQLKTARDIDNKLGRTFSTIDRMTKEAKSLLKKLKSYDKQLTRFEKKLAENEHKAAEKFRLMEANTHWLHETPQSENVHGFALRLAQNISNYLTSYRKLCFMAGGFDNTLLSILQSAYRMAQLTEAYEQMLNGIREAEEAANKGVEAVLQILKVTVESGETTIDEISATLKALDSIANSERDYVNNIQTLIKWIEQQMIVASQGIAKLKQDEMRLSAKLEELSAILGQVVGAAVNHKISIDSEYVKKAAGLTSQMDKANSIAGQAYKEARKATAVK